MKNKIVVLIILTLLAIAIQCISFLPWWFFAIIMFLLGIILPLKQNKIPVFLIGFLAGLFSWLIPTLFFQISYEGKMIQTVSQIFHLPSFVLFVIISFVGGLITGMALYSGFLLRNGKEVLELNLENYEKLKNETH